VCVCVFVCALLGGSAYSAGSRWRDGVAVSSVRMARFASRTSLRSWWSDIHPWASSAVLLYEEHSRSGGWSDMKSSRFCRAVRRAWRSVLSVVFLRWISWADMFCSRFRISQSCSRIIRSTAGRWMRGCGVGVVAARRVRVETGALDCSVGRGSVSGSRVLSGMPSGSGFGVNLGPRSGVVSRAACCSLCLVFGAVGSGARCRLRLGRDLLRLGTELAARFFRFGVEAGGSGMGSSSRGGCVVIQSINWSVVGGMAIVRARGGLTRSVRRAGGGSAQRMDRVPGMKRGPRRAVPVSSDGVCVVLERWAPRTGCHTFGCARAHNIASSRGVRAVMWESMGCCCSGEGSFGSMTLSGHLRGVVVWRVCVWGLSYLWCVLS